MTDIGDHVELFTTVVDSDGNAVAATGAEPAMTLHVIDPAGDDVDQTDAITFEPDSLTYVAVIMADTVPGVWRYIWESFGTYAGRDYGQFLVEDHAPALATPLGTVEGYAAMRGVDVSDAEIPQLELHIAAAGAWVQQMCEMQLVRVDDDVQLLDGRGRGLIMLPELPVVDVSKVEVIDADGVTWLELELGSRWDWSTRNGGSIYSRRCRFPEGFRNVRVTYSHGYDPMPMHIQRLVYALAARAIGSPEGQQITAETLGTYAVRYESLVGGLSATESALLDRLTMPAGVNG